LETIGFLELLHKEWAVITGAPWAFFIVFCIGTLVIWLIHQWMYRERIERYKETISYLKDKLEHGVPANVPSVDELKRRLEEQDGKIESVRMDGIVRTLGVDVDHDKRLRELEEIRQQVPRSEWHALEERFAKGDYEYAYALWQRRDHNPALAWQIIGCKGEIQTKSLVALMEEAGNLLLHSPYFIHGHDEVVQEADAGYRWMLAVCAITSDPMKISGYGYVEGHHEETGVVKNVARASALVCQMLAAKAAAKQQ